MADALGTSPAVMDEVRGLSRRWRPLGHARDGPLLARVLAARGLSDPAFCAAFLEASIAGLHDPSLIPDLDKAAARLLSAARSNEKIVIYGDYDVDGITATAILFHMLRAVAPSCDVSTYVPHRLEEGYGLNADAIRELAAAGARVVVSVDCGITAVAPALVARELNLDLIITDHHNPPASIDDLPDAFAVVHPRHPRSTYPFGDLCGAGVAYKLAWRLATLASGSPKVTPDLRALLIELLALASLGVIADIVPLVGENRVMARHGLHRLRSSRFPGLQALISASGLDGDKVGEEDVGFRLAPRLNACGRMGHAREAVELLTVAQGDRCTEIADMLTRLNHERRAVENAIFQRAVDLVESRGMHTDSTRAIVLAEADWHAGVVGIVCSRLVERYARPVILLARGQHSSHGSGRSIDGFSLHAALLECAAHLSKFGGHDMAAGMTVPHDRLDAFVGAFTAACNRQIPVERLVGGIAFDTHAALGELTPDVIRQLERLAPFGRDNPPIRIRLTGLRVDRPETFGAGNAHLALRVRCLSSGCSARLVAWRWGPRVRDVPLGSTIEAIVTPRINSFNGHTSVEPVMHDLRVVQ